ncbi:hypothetical protein N665_0142s0005 [Sinapis alba]|nr:hypothetical protein N665_0142s0005 [Sinapis alba]
MVETMSKKKKKLTFVKDASEQDETEIFWQLWKAKALEEKCKPICEPVISVWLDKEFPERCVEIVTNLREPLKADLAPCLKENLHMFAWATENMPGININLTCHKLNVDPTFKPIKQKRRKLGPEQATAVNDEFEKLLKVRSITEVRYPDWVANPVVVKKKTRNGESASISLTSTRSAERQFPTATHRSHGGSYRGE